jgi:predicted RNA-binding Zn-ribbon protein involved in translation (DUF1610 family)
VTDDCPACQKGVTYEQWCPDFPCPHCGVTLRHAHDCYAEEDEDGSWDTYCGDWLEVVQV